jgi:hypothetical protein
MDKQWISFLMDKQSSYVLEKEDQRFCSKNCQNKTIMQYVGGNSPDSVTERNSVGIIFKIAITITGNHIYNYNYLQARSSEFGSRESFGVRSSRIEKQKVSKLLL